MKHLFLASDGTLYDTRPSPMRVIREGYRMHVHTIQDTHQFRACLRAGRYTSIGSYPIFFFTGDGAAVCFTCAKKEYRQVSKAIRDKTSNDWRVVGCDVNYEDSDLICDHCSKPIESAYGEQE